MAIEMRVPANPRRLQPVIGRLLKAMNFGSHLRLLKLDLSVNTDMDKDDVVRMLLPLYSVACKGRVEAATHSIPGSQKTWYNRPFEWEAPFQTLLAAIGG